MKHTRAALYARVSSEQQAAAHTIESQIAALTERAEKEPCRDALCKSVRTRSRKAEPQPSET